MAHTASKHRVNPAETIAVFSHNLFNEVTCIAGLVHLLTLTPPPEAGGPDCRDGYLSELAARSERLVERLQHGLLGLAPQPPEAAHHRAQRDRT